MHFPASLLAVLFLAFQRCACEMYCADYTVIHHAKGSQTMLADHGLCMTHLFCVTTSYRTVDGDLQVNHQCAEGAQEAMTGQTFEACRNATQTGASSVDVSTIANQQVQCCAHGHCCNVPIDTQFHCEQYLAVVRELSELKAKQQGTRGTDDIIEAAQQRQSHAHSTQYSAFSLIACILLVLGAQLL